MKKIQLIILLALTAVGMHVTASAGPLDNLACPLKCFVCVGSKEYGGPCYAGYGGPAHAGYGGPLYAGYGGPCYAGYGGPAYAGYGGPCYDLDNDPDGITQCPKQCLVCSVFK